MAQTEPTGARIADIRRAAERARDLASDILAFGGRQAPPAGEVEAGAFIAETATLLRAMLPAGLRLTIAPPPEDAMIWGDAARLQQVVINLCREASEQAFRLHPGGTTGQTRGAPQRASRALLDSAESP